MTKMQIDAPSGTQGFVLTRYFEAPRELVFNAFTDPKHISEWWGPRRMSTEVDHMEPLSGGSWRFINREGDETYAFHGVYHDVHPSDRVIYTFEFEGMPGHVSLETVLFEDRGSGTLMTDAVAFQSIEDRDGMLASMEPGASETMDRLEELVQRLMKSS